MDTEHAPTAGRTILVVDDEAAVAAVTREVLAEYGYTVLASTDPYEAIRLMAAHPVDLLLTDVVMPIMRGTELARRAQQVSPGMKVVLMSGYVVAEAVASGLPFVIKPFSINRLAGAVRDALEGPSLPSRRPRQEYVKKM